MIETVTVLAWVGVMVLVGAVAVVAFRAGLGLANRIADGEAVGMAATVLVLAATWAVAAVAGATLVGLAGSSPLAG